MKAAIVRAAGQTPVYGDFAEPIAGAGRDRITVTAAALSPLARARAAGAHYSVSGAFPAVVGVDGVGRLDDGRRVYFLLPRAPWGAMAEFAVAPATQIAPLPDGLDDVTAAAIANPGMSSWAAFKERAKLEAGETVLINGATGSAGRLAVQIAKHFGAKRVIATGRNVEALQALGADATIALVDDEAALEDRFERHSPTESTSSSTTCGARAPSACSPPPRRFCRTARRCATSRSARPAGRISRCRAPCCARRRSR